MKHSNSIFSILLSGMMASCGLIAPSDTVNPNVDEDAFLHSSQAMSTWVNGTKRSFAQGIGRFCLYTEMISDNYFNNYTRENKVFDIPELRYTDPDIEDMQRIVANLRESADYGIEVVQQYDRKTTDTDLFQLYMIKAYSYILAGENFVALPEKEGGDVVVAKEQLLQAIPLLDKALSLSDNVANQAFIHTLKARTYHRLGDKENAVIAARKSLELSPDFIYQVTFDGVNAVGNALQDVVWKFMFQPLPRLDFLDPKYFQLSANEERPICVGKAEENYLILIEAALADNQEEQARSYMRELLRLVNNRPVQYNINDQLEGRFNGGFKKYPDSSDYRVAASSKDSYRSGLVLNRKAPHLISIPYISGTSVTAEMINQTTGIDALLELTYLLRQEIFFAEGRRMTDLGIRLPVSEVEAKRTASAQAYTAAHIPGFIPMGQGMDAFVIDEEAKTVTIQYNMNKIIVQHRQSSDVLPFF
ncbi:MAG: hypothetical protein PUK67_02985 [Prevotellaceae bacterium]|nr:hypothetical protein [Prevotellaceae bacterium]MDY3364771.1 hypothetical protein [Prevotella sp.]